MTHTPDPHTDPTDRADHLLAGFRSLTLVRARACLDAEAGLREITSARDHAVVRTEAGRRIDIEAGLQAITGTRSAPCASPAAGLPPVPAVVRDPGVDLHPALGVLAALPAVERLRHGAKTRVHTALDQALHLNGYTALAGDVAGSLVTCLELLLAIEKGDRARTLALARARARVRALALARDLDLDLDRVRALARDLAFDLAFDLALDRDLDRDLALDRALALALARDRDRALALARDLAREIQGLRALLSTAATGLPGLPSAVHDVLQVVLSAPYAEAAAVTRQARWLLSDMTGQDLRDADAAGLRPPDLERVRWSAATRWPPAWRTWLQDNSVPVGPDVWEVRPGSASADDDRVGVLR